MHSEFMVMRDSANAFDFQVGFNLLIQSNGSGFNIKIRGNKSHSFLISFIVTNGSERVQLIETLTEGSEYRDCTQESMWAHEIKWIPVLGKKRPVNPVKGFFSVSGKLNTWCGP